MNLKTKKYFSIYIISLISFAIFYLSQKYNVGNDSTISEWLINYEGGFTKRGIIGQICIYISSFFNLELRFTILLFQILIIITYYLWISNFFKDINVDKIIILSIFSPIFLLYPIAEIEVLARKDVFIFLYLLGYLSIQNKNISYLYLIFFTPISVLIWEPVIFFFPFIASIEIIKNNYTEFKKILIRMINIFLPSVIIAFYIALNPITPENHNIMKEFLMNNFGETCYMSCGLLLGKSTLYDQFRGNFGAYSLEVFIRYFLIILIGFGPLFLLLYNSKLKNQEIFFFKNFQNLLLPVLIILLPVIILFAMGYDWGRWVNISYTFSVLFYFYLYKNKIIFLKKIDYKIINKGLSNKTIYTMIFIIFCFGWNPKTVVSGDVASFPGYRIPYKTIKIISNKYIK